jgi:hypothetical protein
MCSNEEFLSIYYDTGHTYSGGHFYRTQFRDAQFEDWRWFSFRDFDVDAEKPLAGKKLLIDSIGKDGDRSLFTSVVSHGPGFIAGLQQRKGWLICDDGSMESADFIHLDDGAKPSELTLIHVKGSGSAGVNRALSVSDFEIVVSQAVKNLRYLDRNHIADNLENNKHYAIKTAVWHNGKRQKDREKALAAFKSTGSNMKKTVCVVQPRVRKQEVERIRGLSATTDSNKSDIMRLKQLDALLLAARAECFGLGASFVVVGDDVPGRMPAPGRAAVAAPIARSSKRRK